MSVKEFTNDAIVTLCRGVSTQGLTYPHYSVLSRTVFRLLPRIIRKTGNTPKLLILLGS